MTMTSAFVASIWKSDFDVGLAERLKRVHQIDREPRGRAAIDDTMIVGHGNRHHHSRLDLPFANNRLQHTLAESENGNLGTIDDWRKVRTANGALIGDRESATAHLFDTELAVACFGRNLRNIFGELNQVFLVHVT